MCLGHGMVDSDKMLIFHIFDGHRMVIVHCFCFQNRQCDAAAADHGIAQSMDDIAANGANIKFAVQHIGGDIFVEDLLAIHQLDDRDAQSLGQRLQQADIRQSFGGFPLGDSLAADANSFCQFRLGHIPGFPKLFNCRSSHIDIHRYPILSEKIIPPNQKSGNLRFVDKALLLWYNPEKGGEHMNSDILFFFGEYMDSLLKRGQSTSSMYHKVRNLLDTAIPGLVPNDSFFLKSVYHSYTKCINDL